MSDIDTSRCMAEEVCQYDRACPFYAMHCRLTEPQEPEPKLKVESGS